MDHKNCRKNSIAMPPMNCPHTNGIGFISYCKVCLMPNFVRFYTIEAENCLPKFLAKAKPQSHLLNDFHLKLTNIDLYKVQLNIKFHEILYMSYTCPSNFCYTHACKQTFSRNSRIMFRTSQNE